MEDHEIEYLRRTARGRLKIVEKMKANDILCIKAGVLKRLCKAIIKLSDTNGK